MQYTGFIEETLQKAAKIANKYFGHVEGRIKDKATNQVVTDADLEIGSFIIKQIQLFYPKHNIIDEEKGVIRKNSEFTWIIDPIDGTSNYAMGIPLYGCMFGLLKGVKPIAGGVALPYFSQICTAEKGKGAFCNGLRLQVTSETKLSNLLISYGTDQVKRKDQAEREARLISRLIASVRNLRASNSVFDSILVAKGRYGGFLNTSSKIWDNVAQQIVIEEAGGVYTDFEGLAIDYSDPLSKATQNYNYCTAAPKIHAQLLRIIHVNTRPTDK